LNYALETTAMAAIVLSIRTIESGLFIQYHKWDTLLVKVWKLNEAGGAHPIKKCKKNVPYIEPLPLWDIQTVFAWRFHLYTSEKIDQKDMFYF
jgi:hypothetical protein